MNKVGFILRDYVDLLRGHSTSAAILEAGESLLARIPVLTSETHGRYSKLQRVALRAPVALRAREPCAKKDSRGRPRAWVFAETNTGGSMVKSTIRAIAKVKVKTERARQSKAERASPVSALAEAGLVHMVGKHDKLEKQLAKFTGQEGGHGRDDRADAFAWPIFKYVVRKRQNAGAAERPEASADGDDTDLD